MSDHYLHHLMKLIQNGLVHASYSYMKSLPLDINIPNRQKLFAELEEKVLRAQTLVRDVNSHLQKGAYPRALTYLTKAQSLVPDYPNIQTDIDFISSTMTDIANNLNAAKKAAGNGDKQAVRNLLAAVAKFDRHNDEISHIEAKLAKTLKGKRLKKMIALSLTIILPLLYISFEHKAFEKGNLQWHQAREYLAKQQFHKSQQALRQATSELKQVRFFQQKDKDKILLAVNALQASTLFRQGLEGKVLAEGTFIAKKTHQQNLQLAKLEKEAEAQLESDPPASLAILRQALTIAQTSPQEHGADIVRLNERIAQQETRLLYMTQQATVAKIEGLFANGDDLLTKEKWLAAKDVYAQGEQLAQTEDLPQSANLIKRGHDGQTIADIQIILAGARLLEHAQKVDAALISYDQALALAQQNKLENYPFMVKISSHLAELHIQQSKKQLVKLERAGDTLFAQHKYSAAQQRFTEALHYQQRQARAIVDQDANARFEKKIRQSKRLALVASKQELLLAKYKGILVENFNLSPNTFFYQPRITLVADHGNYFIFKISALASRSRATVRQGTKYEVEYKYPLQASALVTNQLAQRHHSDLPS